VIILTEWNPFRKLELERLRGLVKTPLIIDLRNLYEPDKMAEAGFDYISIGRPDGRPTPRLTGEKA
jgi:UDPglucose 6-dehydrogenase